MKIKRGQAHAELSMLQDQWDDLDTSLAPLLSENSGQDGDANPTQMETDSDTEKVLRKSKRKFRTDPSAARRLSKMLIRTAMEEGDKRWPMAGSQHWAPRAEGRSDSAA